MPHKYTVEWTGKFPTLCAGKWVITIDDKDVSDTCPFNNTPDYPYATHANTLNTYTNWSFGPNYDEVPKKYTSGHNCDLWCKDNADWLKTVAPEEDWPILYNLFKASDWRHHCCRGCL